MAPTDTVLYIYHSRMKYQKLNLDPTWLNKLGREGRMPHSGPPAVQLHPGCQGAVDRPQGDGLAWEVNQVDSQNLSSESNVLGPRSPRLKFKYLKGM